MTRRISRTALLALAALVAAGGMLLQPGTAFAAPCPTGGGGVISSNTSWTVDCELSSDVTVNAGVTLTISPGVTISISNPNTRLLINGTLVADGASGSPITFTSGDGTPAAGDWNRLEFGPTSANSLLDFVIIRHGGGIGFPMVVIRSSGVTISNSNVTNAAEEGIEVNNGATPTLTNVTLAANGGDALVLNDSSRPSLSNLAINANGFDGAALGATLYTTDYAWGGATGVDRYRFLGSADVTVGPGATLTIAAGTTIQNNNVNNDLIVQGTLNAIGTAAERVTFTSAEATPAPFDWGRIVFEPGSSGTLDFATVEYGGGPGTGTRNTTLDIRSSAVTISNSIVRFSDQDGMTIRDASPTIASTAFENNGPASGGWAISLTGNSFPALSGPSASGNGFDGVALDAATLAGDYTWGAGGLSRYLVMGSVTVPAATTLTIAPGTTVFLDNPNTDLTIRGTLVAQGSAAAPIRLASGDIYTPGGTPASEIGDWGQIDFDTPESAGVLEHVTVEHGGGFGFAAVDISSSNVTIRNSTIARNEDQAILVRAGSPTITLSNIVENGGDGLANTGSALVQATCNWWGAASGPTNEDNPPGAGQAVEGPVVFSPWLIAPAPGGACLGTLPVVYLPLVVR